MRKVLPLTVLVNFLILSLAALLPTSAVSVTPSSGTLAANSTQTISIVASPPSGAEAVQIRLLVTGDATVTGYTGPSGVEWSPGPIGVCAGSTTYTSTQVCADLANSGTIATGQSLGSFTIITGDEGGTVTIVRDTDNGYLVSSVIEPQTGTVGTYSIGSSTLTALPNTAITDDPKYVIIFGALSLITLGIFVYKISPFIMKKERKEFNY